MVTLQHVLQALIAAPEREYARFAIMFAAQKSSELGYASDKLAYGEMVRIMLVQRSQHARRSFQLKTWLNGFSGSAAVAAPEPDAAFAAGAAD